MSLYHFASAARAMGVDLADYELDARQRQVRADLHDWQRRFDAAHVRNVTPREASRSADPYIILDAARRED